MNRTEKEEIISTIKDHFQNANAVYLIDYKGVDVEDINQLRRNFRNEGVTYKVFKNTLLKRAYDDLGSFEKFDDVLPGMTGVAFSGENFVAPAKIIKKYFDANSKFSLKGAYIDNAFYGSDDLEALASMPSKEEVIAGILGSINSPASGIVGALNGVIRDLVSVVDQIAQQKAA
jgi:large subunit ribosomal protein L10